MEGDEETLLTFVESYSKAQGYPPSVREITAALGLSSTRKAHEMLVSLRGEGRVEWDEGRVRTLRVVRNAHRRSSA